MMEAYSYSDPTRAEDGHFLNPSETLILNGAAYDWDEDDLAAFGFAPGEDQSAEVGDDGAPLKGNPPVGNQHSSDQIPLDDVSRPDEQTQEIGSQTGEDTNFDLEADLETAFDDFLGEQQRVNENRCPDSQANPGQPLGEQPPAGEDQAPDVEADLEAAFDEFLVPKASQVRDPLDDNLEALFTPDDDDDLDSLFSPDADDDEVFSSGSPPSHSTREEDNSKTKLDPSAVSIYPSWLASLPSLPKPVQNNGPTTSNLPVWQPGASSQPPVAQSNGVMPAPDPVQSTSIRSELMLHIPPAVPYQYLPAPNPLPPAMSHQSLPAPNSITSPSIQPGLMRVSPIVPDQYQTVQTTKRLLTYDSFFQLGHAGSEGFHRSFIADMPIEPIKKKQKMIVLPRSSETPAFFQMDKLVYRDFEKLAKAFVLDRKHPQRYADGSGNVQNYHKSIIPTLANFTIYPAQFLDEGAGEEYFGAKSDGYATRTLKWPEHKDDIADLVLSLFRKVCKNEDQRLYAERNRNKEKAKAASSEEAAKADHHRRKQSAGSLKDIAQSPISISSSPPAQSSDQSDRSQHSTRTSSPESLPNQSFAQVSTPNTSASSTCVQAQVPPLVPAQGITHAQRPPTARSKNDQLVAPESAPVGNGQPFVFNFIPFSLPPLQFSINFVLDDKRYVTIQTKIDLVVGIHPSHLSMLNFIYETIPKDYYLCSFSVHGPTILRQIQNADVYNAAVMEISLIPWMGREVKCIAGLAKKTTDTRTTIREVIVID